MANRYEHEFYSTSQVGLVRHVRNTVLSIGLLIPKAIATTTLRYVATTHDKELHSSIIVPNAIDTAAATLSRTDSPIPTMPTNVVESADLQSFITSGVEGWKKIIHGLLDGSVVVELSLDEIIEDKENLSPAGLILPSEVPEQVFQAYVATPDEITALERMTAAINAGLYPTLNGDSVGLGNYL